jgi:hypothetical protein
VPYVGNTDWIEDTLLRLKACLDSDAIPPAGDDCDYCKYREAVGKKLQAQHALSKKVAEPAKESKKKDASDITKPMF